MPFQQSVVMPMLKPSEMAVGDFLDEIHAIGYRAIEIWNRPGDYEAIVEEVRRRDMTLASMVGHEEGFTAPMADPSQHDRLECELRESIGIAARDGVPGIIVLPGPRTDRESPAQSLAKCASFLRRLAPYAEEKRVNLNVELLNTKVDHPGYLVNGSDRGALLCELADHPRCRLLYDIYHMQIMEGDLNRTIRSIAKWIGHFHTAGNPGRHEIDGRQEINYPSVCRAIAATGFQGFVGHEFNCEGDPLESLRQAFALCQA